MSLDIMNWYFKVLKMYANFSGRARRKEYWMFTLFHYLAIIILFVIDGITGSLDSESGFGLLSALYILGTIIPGLAVTVRRLHDSGRTGWWLLLYFIPLIGPLTIFIFTVFDSEPSTNEYGDNPKTSQA